MMENIKRFKVSEHFMLDEFIDPVTYNQHGERSRDFIDSRLFDIAEFIRVESGAPVVINNYLYAKASIHIYKESGTRRPESRTGAKYSAHKFFLNDRGQLQKKGMAIDIKMQGKNGKEMYGWVYEHRVALHKLGLKRVEHHDLTPSWCHLDVKDHGNTSSIVVIGLTDVRDTWPIAS
jgi:hypothetical protein